MMEVLKQEEDRFFATLEHGLAILDGDLDLEGPVGAGDLGGSAARRGVGGAKPAAPELEARERALRVRVVARRVVEHEEVDARVEGGDSLVLLGWHLGEGASVDEVDVAGTELLGRLGAVDGHAATADDRDIPTLDLLRDLREFSFAGPRQKGDRIMDTGDTLAPGKRAGLPETRCEKDRLETVAQELLRPLRAVSCHLGGSSSICWSRDGKSVGTSMGMSPQSGLPQNNRAGDLDPFVLLHVAKATGRSFEDLLVELSGKAGLAGMSGTSGDMRDLEEAAAAGNARARTAIDVYVGSIRHWLGAGIVELGGLDELAFAGGIGENSPLVRAEVCAGLDDLGIKLDASANAHPGDKSQPGGGERTISAPDSRVTIRVIPTNEELVVARQTRDLLLQKEGA